MNPTILLFLFLGGSMDEMYDWRKLHPQGAIGIDEVGRGCLAGPVYAAAVFMSPDQSVQGLTDSKKISEKRREILEPQIKDSLIYGIGFATVDEIDDINILQASFLAMRRALGELGEKLSGWKELPLLVDGHQRIKELDPSIEQICLVKGDLRAEPISAASIIAKVARDRLLMNYAKDFPDYLFEKNKGYGTKDHRTAIESVGPCEHHRKSFAGVREYL